RSTAEKLSHLSVIQGKTPIQVPELHAGDIGVVAKLRETLTGDTLGDKSSPIQYPNLQLPEPAITFAIEPKTRADEDKLSNGIHKLMEEDFMLRFFRDPQTKEFLIAGTGQQHIEIVVAKLKKRYHTEVVLKAPKVPYHDVDSNELSFKLAGRIAFKKGMEQAKPTLLEPIMQVEITVPDEFAGSIMGDLNSRRGRIQGMDNKGGNTVVKAEVPMAEML